MKRGISVSILSVIVVSVLAAPCQGEDLNQGMLERASAEFASAAKKVLPGVVLIRAERPAEALREEKWRAPADPPRTMGEDFVIPPPHEFHGEEPIGRGAGFLVSSDGYILTASNIVEGAGTIHVALHDGREFDAQLVGADTGFLIAVLRIEGTGFPFLEVGDSDAVEVGEWAMSVGHPYRLRDTMSFGIVSALGRNNLGIAEYEDFIQTDVAIPPGSAGGPLVNVKGKVIGMNVAANTWSGPRDRVGFAIPINTANTVRERIISSGKVKRGYLGVLIRDRGRDVAASLGLEGGKVHLVADVLDGSPAEKAGIAKGDVILQIDGRNVSDALSFRKTIALMGPGTTVTLTLFRDEEQTDVEVVLGEWSGIPGGDRE